MTSRRYAAGLNRLSIVAGPGYLYAAAVRWPPGRSESREQVSFAY
jgi:hypothetical protein